MLTEEHNTYDIRLIEVIPGSPKHCYSPTVSIRIMHFFFEREVNIRVYRKQKIFTLLCIIWPLGCIKGKTTRSKPQHVKVDVTSEQVKGVKVILSIGLMSFTGITFCVTVARDVRFIAASFLQDR